MTPRVLVLTTYYHPVVGGVEVHARQLVRFLHAHDRLVEVVTKRVSRADPTLDEVDGVTVHRVGPIGERRASGKWAAMPAMFSAALRLSTRFDVLVCVDYRAVGIAAIAAGRLRGRRVIVQGEVAGVLAGADAASTSGLAPESAFVRALKAPARAVYRRADMVVCIGRDLEREALRAGVPRGRVEYLPHGVDLARFRPAEAGEREAIRAEVGWPADAHVVLFVGRLSAEKGVMDLLEAWRIAGRTDAVLSLVGPDMPGHPWDAGAAARAFVAAHGLGTRVRFEGRAADPSRFYRAADVFVQPSHFEALGNTALEAMASGVAVVASGVGGLGDFCVDRQTALVHAPHSPASIAGAIATVLDDAGLRHRLAAAGRTLVAEQFELGMLLARYARLIDDVAGAR
jgi:glycosyltransferase involved in cell wall biosynthesis